MNNSLWYTDNEKEAGQRAYQAEFDADRAAEKPVGSRYGFFSNEHAFARPMDQKTYAVWHHVRQACSMIHYDLIGMFDDVIVNTSEEDAAAESQLLWESEA